MRWMTIGSVLKASRRMIKSGKFNKDFRKDGLKSNSEFDGIITKNPKYNASSRRIGRAHPDPLSAGAKTGDAEVDRIKKQTGRLN